MPEVWKPIPEWPMYEASTLGRIRRVMTITGKIFDKPRLLAPSKFRGRYLAVILCFGSRKRKPFVHTLILETFIGPRPEGLECCHGNGDGCDNRLTNLRWATHQENYADSIKHGTAHLDKGHLNVHHTPQKLTAQQVLSIRAEYVPYRVSKPSLAKKYNVHTSMIQAILDRRKWNHI